MTPEEAEIWASNLVECDLCTYRHVAVYICDNEKLECPNCSNMVTFTVLPTDEQGKLIVI